MKLDTLLKRYSGDLQSLQRLAAAKLHSGVTSKTPIDRGSAQNSWTPALNEVKTNNVIIKKGNPTELNRNPIAPVINKMKLGDDFYLANGLPYIRVLEYTDHSPQGKGMVSRTRAEWQQIITKAAKEL